MAKDQRRVPHEYQPNHQCLQECLKPQSRNHSAPTPTFVFPSPIVSTSVNRHSSSSKHQRPRTPLPGSTWHTYSNNSTRNHSIIYDSSSTPHCSSTPDNDVNSLPNGKENTDISQSDKSPSSPSLPDTNDNSKNWGSFKSWFKNQTPPLDSTSASQPLSSQNQQPSQSDSDFEPSQKINSPDLDKALREEASEKGRTNEPFRWPWHNDNGTNGEKKDNSDRPNSTELRNSNRQSKPKKRVKHNDSKPGAIGFDDSNFENNSNNITNVSMQDRFKQLVEVIIPNKQQSEEQPNNENRDFKGANGEITQKERENSDNTSQEALPIPSRGSGIFELYKPPEDKERAQGQSGSSKKQWFTPPWSRDSTTTLNSSELSTRAADLPNSESTTPASNSKMKLDSGENEISPKDESSSFTDKKSWFKPPWKQSKSKEGDHTISNEGTKGEEETQSESIDIKVKRALSNSESSEGNNTKVTDTTTGKIKITFPSKKPWFRRPGTQRKQKEDDNRQDIMIGGEVISQDDKQRNNTDLVGSSNENIDRSPAHTEGEIGFTKVPSITDDPDAKKGDDDQGSNQLKEKELVEAGSKRENGRNLSDYHSSLETYSIPQRDISRIRQIFGSETFFATDTIPAPGGLLFHGNLRGEPEAAVDKLEERLSSRFGNKYTLCLAEGEDQGPVVVVVPTSYHQLSAAPRHRLLALGLAMMTTSTCLSRGLMANVLRPRIVSAYGLPPKVTIFQRLIFSPMGGTITVALAIGALVLLSQVVVRKIVASRYKTKLAMPFMLPSYQLGSFGAVVYLVSPAPSRAALFDIAIAGTITMVIPAMICLVIGLRLSTSFTSVLPVPMSMISGSLLMGLMTRFIPNGQILVDYQRSLIGLHPLAIIGANCLTIAALNLLPIRQLDGSRIIAALFGRRAAVKAWRMAVLYVLFASSKNPFLIMFLLIVSFGPWQVDRPSRNELTEPDNVRTLVGYVFMLLMIGLLLPYPKSSFFGTL